MGKNRRRAGFARCLPDAERHSCGVVLTLNYSQVARDGLQTAAQSFARFASQRGAHGEAARQLAIAMAQTAPTHVWWRPLLERTRPHTLGRDDTWRSLAELRTISGEIAGLASADLEARSA